MSKISSDHVFFNKIPIFHYFFLVWRKNKCVSNYFPKNGCSIEFFAGFTTMYACASMNSTFFMRILASILVEFFKRKLKGDFGKEQKKNISSNEPSEWMLNICRRMCFLCSFCLISVWNVYCLCIFIFNFLCYSQFRYHIQPSASTFIEITLIFLYQMQLHFPFRREQLNRIKIFGGCTKWCQLTTMDSRKVFQWFIWIAHTN